MQDGQSASRSLGNASDNNRILILLKGGGPLQSSRVPFCRPPRQSHAELVLIICNAWDYEDQAQGR